MFPLQIVRKAWVTAPLSPPRLESDWAHRPFFPRAVMVFGYWLRRGEYWLSPQGGLRCWLKLNVSLCILVLIPTVLLVPLGTCLLTTLATWAELLAQIGWNLLQAVAYAIATVVLIVSAVFLFYCFFGSKR